MLILSRVCADFRNAAGEVLFRVTPADRLTFREAPDAIREDPLFQLLLEDGSLEVADSLLRQKTLEADPMKDAEASGRRASGRKPVKTDETAEK